MIKQQVQGLKVEQSRTKGGEVSGRSARFLADVRKADAGELTGGRWRADQDGRKRSHKLRQSLEHYAKVAAGEVEEQPLEHDGKRDDQDPTDELSYPAGTWMCSKCGAKVQSLRTKCPSYSQGKKCEGTIQERNRWVVAPNTDRQRVAVREMDARGSNDPEEGVAASSSGAGVPDWRAPLARRGRGKKSEEATTRKTEAKKVKR